LVRIESWKEHCRRQFAVRAGSEFLCFVEAEGLKTPSTKTTYSTPPKMNRCLCRLRLVSWLVLVPLLLIAWCESISAATLVVGTNVNTSRLAGNQSEAAIAMDPTNPERLFVFSNMESSGLFAAYSTNAGASWRYTDPSDGTIADGGDNLPAACCDPSATWDRFGNLFISYINANLDTVVVLVSTNGGVSFFLHANLAVGHNVDQPTIVASVGSAPPGVWITYKDFNLSGTPVVAQGAQVTGLGAIGTFTAAQSAPGSANGSFGDIVVGPAGQVMVTYESPSSGQGPANILINVDVDGFGPGGFAAARTVTSTGVGGFHFIPAQSRRSVDTEAGLAWDNNPASAHFGRVYLMYTDEAPNESNNTDIKVRFSDNNGTNWSAAVRVNDDATTRSQFLPRMAIDPTSGNLAVSWHDCRNDSGSGAGDRDGVANTDAQFYAAVSEDGGATWSPNVRIGPGTSSATTANNGIDYGDYSGLTFYNGSFHAAWADNSNSTGDNPNGSIRFDIYTARVTMTPDSTSADLALSMSASPNPVVAGNPLTYTLTVLNNGPTNANVVMLTNFLPASVTFGLAISSQGTCTNIGNNVICALGSFASNATATVTITVTPNQAGTITNTATVVAGEPDPSGGNNIASAVTTVSPAPPVIFNVTAVARPTSAIITWDTLTNATSQIEYGFTTNYQYLSPLDVTLRTNHAVLLVGLVPNTNYFFRVIARVGTNVFRSAQLSFSTDLNFIVDNPQARYGGNWTLGTSSPDKFGSYYQFAQTSASPSPGALATYAPALPVTAKYDVYIWYPAGPNRTTNAQVTIFFNGGSVLRSVNQTVNGGSWQLLATELDFAAGTDGFATIGNNTGESGKVVMADAMRWSYSTSQDFPPDGSVPAWWTDFYFGGETDVSVDHDEDGYTTYQEYVLATDPTNAASRLEFRAERNGGGLKISFSPASGGRVYQLASTTDLNSGTWTLLPDAPAVNGAEGTFNIPDTATPGRRYYRLVVHLAP
jgi:uncharacterized repeat protein (TIGR01451 family)